ncbi:hypothetical protein NBRC116494_11410 [Aurantivibrio plasticivorans]
MLSTIGQVFITLAENLIPFDIDSNHPTALSTDRKISTHIPQNDFSATPGDEKVLNPPASSQQLH